jgi:hypothetical protein
VSFAPPASFTLVNSMHRRASIPKQQGNVALKAHIANICFKCFRCFEGILQVFYMNVVKVDRNVAYAASVSEACCKYLFKSVSSVLDEYCNHFDLDVVYVSHICCKSMFQMF